MARPQPPLIRRAAMGLLVAVGLLATVELGLRMVLGPAPNPVKVYGALGEHDAYFEVSDGQAQRLYGEVKLPPFSVRSTEPRVAVLGGSSIHQGTPNLHPSRELPARLATQLDRAVVNLGSPGLDSHDIVEIVNDIGEMDFAALVVYTGHNDLGNTIFERRYGTLPSAIYAHLLGGLSHLQLFSQLSRRLVPRTGTLRRTRPNMRPEEGEVLPLDPMRRALAITAFEKNLERIAWLTEQRGQPLVLVVPVSDLTAMPGDTSCEPGLCPADHFERARLLSKDNSAAAIAILRSMRDTDPACVRAPTQSEDLVRAVAHRFDHITLVDPFELLTRDPTFDIPNRRLFIDPVHFSPEGHREMARILEDPIRAVLIEN